MGSPVTLITRRRLLAALAILGATIATTWPFRSHYLISWDAANFAFALDRIDIAAHRPHPPGYLGYVFAGRGLRFLFPDANTALTAWNVLARSAAALLAALLARSATGGSNRAAFAAAATLLASPLLWFYASNAEIYPTEMALSLAIAFACVEARRGRPQAVYWAAALLAITALFKMSATVLMAPAVLYTVARSPRDVWRPSAIVFSVVLGMVGLIFYIVQPDVLSLVWGQFNGATGPSRVVGGTDANIGLHFNRNIRDTFTNLLAALGLVNAAAVLAWAIADRRLPRAVDPWLLLLWTLPWIGTFVLIHIGNAGYVLPLLPIACLVAATWYARRTPGVYAALIAAQAIVNMCQVAFLVPGQTSGVRYRDKSILARLASDLQPMAFPTRATIRQSDVATGRLFAETSACTAGPWVLVAAITPIDWRRTTYYFPNASAIHLGTDGLPDYIGRSGDTLPVSEHPAPLASACGLIWITTMADDRGMPRGGHYVDGLGVMFPAGSGEVSSAGVTWTPR
jgi:hypothetical protein